MTRTEQEAIARAATAYANGIRTCQQMTPREQAEAAWTPTSRHTVDELEDLIRQARGLDPIRQDQPARAS